LPPGFFNGVSGLPDQFSALVDDLKQHMNLENALARLAEQLIVPKPPPGDALLMQEEELTVDTVLERRKGVICRSLEGPGYAGIHYSGGRIMGPGKIAPALRFVSENRSFPVRSLDGGLSDKEKLVLARRLVKEGLLCVTVAGE
jgi:lysine-specific demethylase/histidyl-hydroxylase NO66